MKFTYDPSRCTTLRWSVRGLRGANDLRSYVARLQDVRERAEAAARASAA